MTRIVILSVLYALATTQPTHAYIDPGTASIALQAVIGAIAVTGFYFRRTIARMLRLFSPGSRKRDSEAQHRPAGPSENNTDGG